MFSLQEINDARNAPGETAVTRESTEAVRDQVIKIEVSDVTLSPISSTELMPDTEKKKKKKKKRNKDKKGQKRKNEEKVKPQKVEDKREENQYRALTDVEKGSVENAQREIETADRRLKAIYGKQVNFDDLKPGAKVKVREAQACKVRNQGIIADLSTRPLVSRPPPPESISSTSSSSSSDSESSSQPPVKRRKNAQSTSKKKKTQQKHCE